MTGLTTHVLDTALGIPAKGMMIDLFRINEEVKEYIRTVRTNADGTTWLMAVRFLFRSRSSSSVRSPWTSTMMSS